MLLAKAAEVNAQGKYYGNALYAASSGGHKKVVEMLLAKSAEVNAQGGYCGNALQAALDHLKDTDFEVVNLDRLWTSLTERRLLSKEEDGEGDRGNATKFFSTIATQLVHSLPDLKSQSKFFLRSLSFQQFNVLPQFFEPSRLLVHGPPIYCLFERSVS
ncbi:hypothetical protein GJ744_006009 [Endocarpon pusillum]|uniref:Ankyrin repeat protein n=1 Tax=Endocarpon pusillum TaxID=364733 RepID=A0A8H7DWV9_9EURO|nr:hypothetical protein GJ744_006009 [Endocarpon pusillum]